MSVSEQFPPDATGVQTLVRFERADRTATEFRWDDSGRLCVTRFAPDGSRFADTVGDFEASGSFSVDEPPVQRSRRMNPYGSWVDQMMYPDGCLVEHVHDDDARLRAVRVSGPWGSQALDLHTDGSRTLRWRVAGLRGVRQWDATGATTASVEPAGEEPEGAA